VVEGALRQLWDRGVCHGDLYGHNVLVAWDENGNFETALSDLGAGWLVPEEWRDAVWTVEKRALDVLREELHHLGKGD